MRLAAAFSQCVCPVDLPTLVCIRALCLCRPVLCDWRVPRSVLARRNHFCGRQLQHKCGGFPEGSQAGGLPCGPRTVTHCASVDSARKAICVCGCSCICPRSSASCLCMCCVQHAKTSFPPGLYVLSFSAACLELCVCIAQIAGQQSGVNVVDKAQSAVNTVKIINALNEISDILKVSLSATMLLRIYSLRHPAKMYPFCPPHSALLVSC